ncbi:fructosamine kinase family protein, partial [Actinomyces stomatis]
SACGEAPVGGAADVAAGGPAVVGVLIDPMAQGAHAETDLAALGVFGQRYLDRIYAAYHEVSPLAEGWRERVGLHSWHIIMIHAFLFGGGYGGEAVAVARQYL